MWLPYNPALAAGVLFLSSDTDSSGRFDAPAQLCSGGFTPPSWVVQPHSQFVIPSAANRLVLRATFLARRSRREGSLFLFGCVPSFEFCEACWLLASTGRAI